MIFNQEVVPTIKKPIALPSEKRSVCTDDRGHLLILAMNYLDNLNSCYLEKDYRGSGRYES